MSMMEPGSSGTDQCNAARSWREQSEGFLFGNLRSDEFAITTGECGERSGKGQLFVERV